MKEELAGLLLSLFKGNPNFVSVERPGENPRPYPLPRPLTPAELAERHLEGKCAIGVYLIDPANQHTHCSAVDFDDHGGDGQQAIADARTVYQFLVDNSFSPLLEISQSGTGAHVWLIHSCGIPAAGVRTFWKAVLRQCECKAEVYPKQDSVEGLEKSLGNYLRLPGWKASHFESVTGEVLDPVQLLKSVQKTTPYAMQSRTEAWYVPETPLGDVIEFQAEGLPERVKNVLNLEPDSLLAKRWALDTDGMMDASRSGIVQAIATELVRKYIPTPEIESSLRWWCAQQRYEKDNRWLHQTLLKAYGFVQGLKQQESIRAATFCGMVHRVADQMEDGIIIPTGIEGLDASIQGFGLGELCYLAARPGNCKTSAALECLDAASASGFPGLFLSMEMSQRPIGRRVLTRMGYDTESVQKMNMEQVHWEIDRYYEARSPLYFLEDVRDLKGICDTVREYVTRKGVKLVVLDHQGCIQTGISNEYDSISKAVEALANLKRELDIAVLVLAHLNREFDSERGRPKMRHLRGSGALENWADMILAGRWMFTEAPDIESNKERYIFHVLKCRNREAKNPDVDAKFMGYRQKFS